MTVFELERERSAFVVHGDMVHYVRDKHVRSYDINAGSDIELLSVRKFGSPYVPPRTSMKAASPRSLSLATVLQS